MLCFAVSSQVHDTIILVYPAIYILITSQERKPIWRNLKPKPYMETLITALYSFHQNNRNQLALIIFSYKLIYLNDENVRYPVIHLIFDSRYTSTYIDISASISLSP